MQKIVNMRYYHKYKYKYNYKIQKMSVKVRSPDQTAGAMEHFVS